MRLFDRSARGYVLTAAGEHMLASAERVEDEILGLERLLLGSDVRLAGSLRVTTTDTLVHGLLGPHLRAFQAAYPAIELERHRQCRLRSVQARGGRGAAPQPAPGRRHGRTPARRVAVALYGDRDYLERGRPASAAGWQDMP